MEGIPMTAGRKPASRRSISVGRRALVIVLVAALAFVLSGCGGSASPSPSSELSPHASFYTGGTPGGTPVRGGSATVDLNENIKTLDPIALVGPAEDSVGDQLFDQLLEYQPGSSEPQPALAQSWSVSKNGLVYTFHIRAGVRFANGTPLTAEDVAYSLLLEKRPIAAAGAGFRASTWKVSATGPMTVQLTLTEPFPGLLGYLAAVQVSIVPKKYFERVGPNGFARHPIGTGPFRIRNATPTYTTINVERNPYYWRAGQPYLDGVVFNVVPETNARILAVRSGTATIATGISFSQIATLKSTPGVRMVIEPLQDTDTAFFNDGKAPFNNVKVRQALNYATPREEIINAVFKGMGEPANDPIGHLQYWDPSVPAYPYDLAKAKKLLKESPYPNGFSTIILSPSGEPDASLIASILQSTWAKIGVHVSIQNQEIGTLGTNIFASKFDVALVTDESFVTEEYPPDVSLVLNFNYPDSGTRSDGTDFDSPTVIALIRKATSTANVRERPALFSKIQRLIISEAADDTIAELPSRTLVSSSVRGFQVLPTNIMRLGQIWLTK